MVTHPGTNQAPRRVTTLIENSALLLNQTLKQGIKPTTSQMWVACSRYSTMLLHTLNWSFLKFTQHVNISNMIVYQTVILQIACSAFDVEDDS